MNIPSSSVDACANCKKYTTASVHHCRTVQESLAGGTVLQVVKQLLRIKSFYGVSENAVESQLWIAVSVYVLCALIKKRLHLEQTLYTILQTLSLALFEKTPLFQLLSQTHYTTEPTESSNQMILFN